MLTSSHCILNLIPMVYRTLLPMCSWLSTHRKPNPLDPCLKFRAKKILSWNIDPLSMNIEPFTYNIMNPMIFWTQHLPMGYHTLDSESSKTAMKNWIPLPWYIDNPTHGISKPYPWYFDSVPIEYQIPLVLNSELSNTAIEYLLPSMIYWTPCL